MIKKDTIYIELFESEKENHYGIYTKGYKNNYYELLIRIKHILNLLRYYNNCIISQDLVSNRNNDKKCDMLVKSFLAFMEDVYAENKNKKPR